MEILKQLNNQDLEPLETEEDYVLNDLDYIVEFTKMTSVLRKGCDVMQLENGDSIVSQTKVVHTHYKWNRDKKKFVKSNQYESK
jgi:hypothetical protein